MSRFTYCLDDQQWQVVEELLMQAQWRVANPILQEMGKQRKAYEADQKEEKEEKQ